MAHKVHEDIDLVGAGDLLLKSHLAGGIPKCMYSDLSHQTLREGRFEEQRDICVKAKAAVVAAGEGRRRAAKAAQMKLRCISEHGMVLRTGSYLCWFSPEGRLDYFGEISGGKAHGWGLVEYQDGSWCLSEFCTGYQHTSTGGRDSTIQFGNGIRYVGTMANGKMHGKGTKTWPDGTEYTGQFCRGKEHGQGVKRWLSGSEYTGEFHHGVRDGIGLFISHSGVITEGRFKDSVFDVEDEGIVAPYKADITNEQGQYNPDTLLDLAVRGLAMVTDRQPTLSKASEIMAK
ncbi:unnamed protein product, partial [Choristocarpus tenellus]